MVTRVLDCSKQSGLENLGGVKGHHVRKQAKSCTDPSGVDPATICQTAMWHARHGISPMLVKITV